MHRSGFFALALAAALAVPASATAVQVVLADTAVNHTQATGAFSSVGIGMAPANFTTPNDYAQGMIHHRVIVTTAPTNAMSYRVCLIQGAQRACSANAITINGAGTFEATQAVTTFTNYGNLTWTMPLTDIEVVALDSAGVAVDASETTWIGSPDFALYYPMDLTYQAVLVANGDAFTGYPGMMAGNPAETPALSPNGGTFEGSVAVSLASGTAAAMIYYTTDGTDPDNTSTLYDGTAINLTAPTTIRAITYATGFDPSPTASADFNIVAELANGLRGRYYDSDNFEGLAMTRTDPTIDFVYPDGNPPAPDIGGTYSILWTGQVTPRYTDTYTFKTVNDDGVRLWINDQLVIDDWNYHGPQERTGTISLTANQAVSVWLEYFNGGGEGTIQLSWESPQQPDEIIPDTALVPTSPGAGSVMSFVGETEIEVSENDRDPIVVAVRRRGNLDAATNVVLNLGGTAVAGEDFSIAPSVTIAFEAGAIEGSATIGMINDAVVEEDETITMTIMNTAAYTVGNPSMKTITITDDDVEVDSIAGTITYTGTKSGNIVVEAFRETDPVFAKRTISLLNPGAYTIADLEEGAYTVIAFIDSDDDEQLDDDEIWGIYQDANLQPALVTIPPGQTGIDINLDVAPGEAAGGDEDGGCCATISSGPDAAAGWLAMLLGAAVLVLRRRRATTHA